MQKKVTYRKSGIDYSVIDPLKRLALKAGSLTSSNLTGTAFTEVKGMRGESAYVVESRDCYFAFVTEGLGSKNLIADELNKITGKTYYEAIAQDTVAMIVNDLITVGARPLVVTAYWSAGSSGWFSNGKRSRALVRGWKKACDLAHCAWGGGETPVLKGIVAPSSINLAGSAFGVIRPKTSMLSPGRIRIGDEIILVSSSGIHANGLTLARKILEKVNSPDLMGIMLIPTHIYSGLITALIDSGIKLHYCVNITGHGWRKLMRSGRDFTYEIFNTGKLPYLFHMLQKYSGLSDREMYATFNMGAGFALYAAPGQSQRIVAIAKKKGYGAWMAGVVKKGPEKVVIIPLGIKYDSGELNIR